MNVLGIQIIAAPGVGNALVCANTSIEHAPAEVLAHQTNCMGVMGRGVALTIRQAFPEVFPPYRALCKSANPYGTTQLVELTGDHRYRYSPSLYVANMFGQYYYGTNRQQTDYAVQMQALAHLRDQMWAKGLTDVAFPINMGCALGGGRWDIVLPNILKVFANAHIQLVFVSPLAPTAPAVQQTISLLRA